MALGPAGVTVQSYSSQADDPGKWSAAEALSGYGLAGRA